MSRKKRQTVTLLILCLVLIAFVAGYFGLTRYQAAKETAEKAEESDKELFQLSADDINSIKSQIFDCSKLISGLKKSFEAKL